MLRHAFWLVRGLLLLSIACRPPNDSTGPKVDSVQAEIGAACTRDEDCGGELTCVKEAPGGFCTKRCATSCDDEKALCVKFSLPDGQSESACAPLCETVEDCRTPYQCIRVGRVSVCGL